MFVLVDLEWVHTKNNSCFPTQLAAARVNADWEKTDAFFSFIRPQSDVAFSCNHMAFDFVWKRLSANGKSIWIQSRYNCITST